MSEAIGEPFRRHSCDDLGELYGLMFSGDDFAPEFHDQDILHFSTIDALKAGDIVAVWLRPECVKPDRPQVTIWRLATVPPPGMTFPTNFHPGSTAVPVLLLARADGSCMAVRCDKLLGVHKNTAVIYADAAPDRQAVA